MSCPCAKNKKQKRISRLPNPNQNACISSITASLFPRSPYFSFSFFGKQNIERGRRPVWEAPPHVFYSQNKTIKFYLKEFSRKTRKGHFTHLSHLNNFSTFTSIPNAFQKLVGITNWKGQWCCHAAPKLESLICMKFFEGIFFPSRITHSCESSLEQFSSFNIYNLSMECKTINTKNYSNTY